MSEYNISKDQLEAFQKHVLKNFDHASKALTVLMGGASFEHIETNIQILSSFHESLGNDEDVVVTIMSSFDAGYHGHMAMMFPSYDARKIVNALLQRDGASIEFDTFERSAFAELGNIVVGAFLTSFSLNAALIKQSVPSVAIDMLKATFDELAGFTAERSENALAFTVKFDIQPIDAKGHVLIVFDAESTKTLLNQLG